jgi:hypothetical protein
MNIQPAQPIPSNSQQPNPAQAITSINAAQLAHIAELLDIVDGFLRLGDGIAGHLADYLRATGRDQPQPPNWAGYNANLLIDQISFTADNLRLHCRDPLKSTPVTGEQFHRARLSTFAERHQWYALSSPP